MGSFPDIYNDPHSWSTVMSSPPISNLRTEGSFIIFLNKPITKGIKRLMADNSGDNNWKSLLEMAKRCSRPLDRGSA